MRGTVVAVLAAAAASLVVPVAHADREEPPPLYGHYDVFVDFARQTFNGTPTPMESKTYPVSFTTTCEVNGCVARMDNSGDQARNPGAPLAYEYRWSGDRGVKSRDVV
ncbi:MBOE_33420 family protein [Mycolicibacterium phlei]